MRKIESLNNAQKTVLQLEKEINAISCNLSKVKNKDHTTMKKIINNINYLLAKDAYQKTLYNNDINEPKEENKKEEEKNQIHKIDSHYQYDSNNNKNLDYLLLLNKQKNNTNREKNLNKPYFNRKCLSSSKININNIECHNNKDLPFKENSNRNKIINYSNSNMNKNNMTYSKPRLLTEYSKRNSNTNITYKNNTFSKNSGSTGQIIKNIKYLTLNENVNKSYKNNKHKKSSILNTLYYNYKDNTENNNFFKNNFLKENSKNKNKIAFSFEQPEILDKQKEIDLKDLLNNKEENNYGKLLESTIRKNKKLISARKMKNNPNMRLNNKYDFYNNMNHNNAYNNDYPELVRKEEDLSKNSITEKEDNYVFSYRPHDRKDLNNNKIEKNFKTWGNYNIQENIKENNYLSHNVSKSLNSRHLINRANIKKNKNKKLNIDNITNDKGKIDILLNMLNVTNINEGIIKVNNLLKYEKNINKLKELYQNGNNEKVKLNIDKSDIWLTNIIKNFKRNEKYKNFCQNIMVKHKLKNFEEFKIFIKDKLNKNKTSKDFSNGKNKICIDENCYLNSNINMANKNDKLFLKERKKNSEENDKDKYSKNSEDINFPNTQNFKIITDYMQTYY